MREWAGSRPSSDIYSRGRRSNPGHNNDGTACKFIYSRISDPFSPTHDRLRLNANLEHGSPNVRRTIGQLGQLQARILSVAMRACKRRDEGPNVFFPLTCLSKRERQEAHGLPGIKYARRQNSARQKDSRGMRYNPVNSVRQFSAIANGKDNGRTII